MDRSRISRSVIGCAEGAGEEGDGARETEAVDARRSMPLRSAWWNRSSQGTGTKTQFSGLGKTPTGELPSERQTNMMSIMSFGMDWTGKGRTHLMYAFTPACWPSSMPVFKATWTAWWGAVSCE